MTHLVAIGGSDAGDSRRPHLRNDSGRSDRVSHDKIVIGAGATSVRPHIGGPSGLDALGATDGVYLLHSMGDTSAGRTRPAGGVAR